MKLSEFLAYGHQLLEEYGDLEVLDVEWLNDKEFEAHPIKLTVTGHPAHPEIKTKIIQVDLTLVSEKPHTLPIGE